MRSKGIRRVPVVDNQDFLVGILSIDDILEFMVEEFKAVIGIFKSEQNRVLVM